jgi:tol-pal system protein YbgF
MLKQRALLLLSLCFAIPAQAGLLEDDEARQQIQKLETRVLKLEDAVKQQTKSMLDLQGQIEAQNTEIRKLRGQNEETAHGLQDAEKRQKDFYVDLDTRLRHFESAEEAAKEAAAAAAAATAAKEAAAPAAAAKTPVAPIPVDPSDPVPEDRAFEAAYVLFKDGSHANAVKAFQDFLKKYPDSVHVFNANYWLGNAQFALKDYRGALDTYQGLLKDFPDTPKTADVLFGVAGCQQGLKRTIAAHKTLKQLIAKYPTSEAAAKAKKMLAAAQ